MRLTFAAVLACLLPVTLSAQWAPFLRPDVPRAADGKPDLNAPPPRLANGKPDFSGVWESRVPPSGRPGPALPSIGDAPPVATFFSVSANMKEGLPFTPWGAELRRQRMAGLRDEGWLDVNGSPFTSAAKVTERFRRVNYGRLEIDITVDDPRVYTRPWTIRVNQRLAASGDELIEFVCNENERSSKHYGK